MKDGGAGESGETGPAWTTWLPAGSDHDREVSVLSAWCVQEFRSLRYGYQGLSLQVHLLLKRGNQTPDSVSGPYA